MLAPQHPVHMSLTSERANLLACEIKVLINEGPEVYLGPVTVEHGIAAGRLPMLHRDPFDRMLVAQARCEGLTLVTRDVDIQRYDVPALPA